MKKLQKALSALTLSAATIFGVVSCMDANNVRNDYYDSYDTNPYSGPKYMLVRVPEKGGNIEYVTTDRPVQMSDADVSRYAGARYKSMRSNQTIDQKTGYKNVSQQDSGVYFVQHNPTEYVPPQGAAKQTSFWWNTSYGCGMNVGYWNYANYCNYGWNHYYAPYSYSMYYNWYWRPSYYYNNSFWYYSAGWNNFYYYGGYNYYYFNMGIW